MKTIGLSTVLLSSLVLNSFCTSGFGDPFGFGVNSFDIDFVAIRNPSNAADTTGTPNPVGSVAYSYRIGKYEISQQMIDKANVLGGLAITRDTRGLDQPATSVSWNEAARFVNWLNVSNGRAPAYKFATQPGDAGYSSNENIQLWTPADAGYNPNNLYRNSLARYFLPSVDEWYKAAYYDPTTTAYYDYPTGSDSAPAAVIRGVNDTAPGTAVYNHPAGNDLGDVTLAGGLSPYGTMGQGGNVWEWEETDLDLVNGPTNSSSARGLRGGNYLYTDVTVMSSTVRGWAAADFEHDTIGFRIASVRVTGDYNGDLLVNAADFVAWRKNNGSASDYDVWLANFGLSPADGAAFGQNGSVPEPASASLLVVAILASLFNSRFAGQKGGR